MMGNTIRKIVRCKKGAFLQKEITEGDDVQLKRQRFFISNKKLTPYSRIRGKFKPDVEFGKITKQAKLVAKNANRSLKKSVRQKYKQEIREQLQNIK
jgi:hypothetical protein